MKKSPGSRTKGAKKAQKRKEQVQKAQGKLMLASPRLIITNLLLETAKTAKEKRRENQRRYQKTWREKVMHTGADLEARKRLQEHNAKRLKALRIQQGRERMDASVRPDSIESEPLVYPQRAEEDWKAKYVHQTEALRDLCETVLSAIPAHHAERRNSSSLVKSNSCSQTSPQQRNKKSEAADLEAHREKFAAILAQAQTSLKEVEANMIERK